MLKARDTEWPTSSGTNLCCGLITNVMVLQQPIASSDCCIVLAGSNSGWFNLCLLFSNLSGIMPKWNKKTVHFSLFADFSFKCRILFICIPSWIMMTSHILKTLKSDVGSGDHKALALNHLAWISLHNSCIKFPISLIASLSYQYNVMIRSVLPKRFTN